MDQRQMHLNLFVHSRGHHEAAWRHPLASPLALTDIDYFTGLARKAEQGCFDSIFLADTLAAGDDVASAPRVWLEPITTLAALIGVTRRIGLIATCYRLIMEAPAAVICKALMQDDAASFAGQI